MDTRACVKIANLVLDVDGGVVLAHRVVGAHTPSGIWGASQWVALGVMCYDRLAPLRRKVALVAVEALVVRCAAANIPLQAAQLQTPRLVVDTVRVRRTPFDTTLCQWIALHRVAD